MLSHPLAFREDGWGLERAIMRNGARVARVLSRFGTLHALPTGPGRPCSDSDRVPEVCLLARVARMPKVGQAYQ